MKIFEVITRSELGGAQSVLVNLSNLLSQNETHEVHVISNDGGEMWGNLSDKIIKHRIKFLRRKISLVDDLRVAFRLRALYNKYKPDVIHLHSSKIGLLGRLVFPKSKIVYTVHGFASIQVANSKFLPIERVLQHKAANIIGVSIFDKKEMAKERITKNVSIIYNGFLQSDMILDDKGQKLYDEIAQLKKDGYKIILSIARLSKQKRFDLFNEIAGKMLDQKIKFVWLGNNTRPDEVISDNVILGGEINNAFLFNRIADLFILTSNYEGLPMSIIEALSYGVPVVASDVGGVSEILNGKNGRAIENDSDLFIKETLHFTNAENTANACRNALKCYSEKFQLKDMYEGYVKIFEDIYNKHNK